MATKLNQIIAIEKGAKADAERVITEAYHLFQKAPLLAGIDRTYRPKDQEGDQLPSERQVVQVRADQVIEKVTAKLARMFDVVLTKEATNTEATANIVVDGTVIAVDVPATGLLFLEKQLVNLLTFVTKLPLLDASEEWTYDPNQASYRSADVETTRTKKVPRNHVKAEATDKHAAQVETYFEDVLVGYWKTVKFSGALPADRVREMRERILKLQDATKQAREAANMADVVDRHDGAAILAYVFGE